MNGGTMKRKKILLLLCTSLLLCGCSADKLFRQKAPDFDTSYTVDADITYGDHKATAQITRYAESDWEFCFTEPSVLMGMKLRLSDDQVTASLGELDISTEAGSVYQMIPDIISSCIDALPELDPEDITENEEILTLTHETNGNKSIITTDKNGSLITLKCPKYHLLVEFNGQTPTENFETSETMELIIFE